MKKLLVGAAAVSLLGAALACAPAGQPAANQTGGQPSQGTAGQSQVQVTTGYVKPELLAESDWLAANLQNSKLRILDLRTKEKYEQGHIPGAVLLTSAQYGDPDDPAEIPHAQRFSKALADAGVSNDSQIVAYDDQGGLSATRLWFLTDFYGSSNVRVLNGGINKWTKEERALSKEAPAVTPGSFTAQVKDGLSCDLNAVQAALNSKDTVILDTRSAGEYNGTDVRASRGGHIPGAINIDWQRNVTNDDIKTFKSAEELREMYNKAGVTPDKKVIAHCQTGVRAAHSMFTLKLIGYGDVKNYDGSWNEWGNKADTPIQR